MASQTNLILSASEASSRRTQSGYPALNAGEGRKALTVGEVVDESAALLAAASRDEPRRLARRIAVAALGLSAAEVFAHPQRRLDAEEHARIAAMTEPRARREEQIYGNQDLQTDNSNVALPDDDRQ